MHSSFLQHGWLQAVLPIGHAGFGVLKEGPLDDEIQQVFYKQRERERENRRLSASVKHRWHRNTRTRTQARPAAPVDIQGIL
jgi:hypothetical protein